MWEKDEEREEEKKVMNLHRADVRLIALDRMKRSSAAFKC